MFISTSAQTPVELEESFITGEAPGPSTSVCFLTWIFAKSISGFVACLLLRVTTTTSEALNISLVPPDWSVWVQHLLLLCSPLKSTFVLVC